MAFFPQKPSPHSSQSPAHSAVDAGPRPHSPARSDVAPAREAGTVIPVLFDKVHCTSQKVHKPCQKVPGGRSGPRFSPSPEQRGAMFGLDARLAMMIFGIMAAVAGYIAFGRIATARHAALITEIEAFTQGLTAYQADMGTFYLFTLNKPVDDDSSLEDLTALWDVSKVKPGFQKRWHGPYVTMETRKSRTYGNWSIFYAQGDRKNYCTTDSDCFIWLSLSQVPAKVWNEVNSYFDEGGGSVKESRTEAVSTGRIQADTPADPRTLIIRTIERPI